MNSRSYSRASLAVVLVLAAGPAAGGAPKWLRDAAAAQMAPQEESVAAVQLLSDVELEVRPDGMLRKRVRAAFRVLEAAGEGRVPVQVVYDPRTRVKNMHVWTLPAGGAAQESGMESATDSAFEESGGSQLVNDIRSKVLLSARATVGTAVGYEYEMETRPLASADHFAFQVGLPVIEARYKLVVPRGWSISASWLNHAAVDPVRANDRTWQWTLRDLPAIAREPMMPSPASVAAQLQVAFAPAGTQPQLANWEGIGRWYAQLSQERLAPSARIREKVAEIVRDKTTPLERFRSLAAFVQSDIRYVAIELGIGGFQPHEVADVFANRFGDCKDKASLLAAMLGEAGIDSVPVLVNTDRTIIEPRTPPGLLFDHVILAALLPREQLAPDILAVADAPDGRALVFFDPTDEISPVGRLAGALQESWGLVATRDGGRLVQLPRMAYRDNGLRRTGELKLDEKGALSGRFMERFTGDLASNQRYALRSATRQADLIRPVEMLLASSLATFRVDGAEASNRTALDQPFEWRYNLVADAYARRSGDLLSFRPRVVGNKAEPLDGKAGRVHDVILPEARMDEDEVVIDLPEGFTVDSIPDAVDMDVGVAAYRSRTEVLGTQLKYTRTYELRELRVPVAKAAEFQRLNAAIKQDERAMVILKRAGAK